MSLFSHRVCSVLEKKWNENWNKCRERINKGQTYGFDLLQALIQLEFLMGWKFYLFSWMLVQTYILILDDMFLWGFAIRFLERSCRYSADQLSDFSSWTPTLQRKPAKWDFCLDKCYFPGFVEETAVSNPRIFSLASEKRLSTLEINFVNTPFYFIYIINR